VQEREEVELLRGAVMSNGPRTCSHCQVQEGGDGTEKRKTGMK